MKKTLPLVLLLMLALPLAHCTSSASFSTGSSSLPKNVEMDGHFGNYTLIAFSSGGKVTVAIFGADESQAALSSEIEWLLQNEKMYTVCDIGSMPAPGNGQETYCNVNGEWADEIAAAPTSVTAPRENSQDSMAFKTALGGARQANALEGQTAQAPASAQQGIGTEQVLQLLGAFLAVLIASYLIILQTRHEPVFDAATEKLLDNPTRAGIMEELSASDKIPTDISARLGKSKAAVVEHLAALSEAGLVERIATPGKKFVFYKLTQKGRQALLRRAG